MFYGNKVSAMIWAACSGSRPVNKLHSHLLNGFEKAANRVPTGIILAALIVGAALMMRVDSSFQIFGYPGIAMICFLIALGGSGWLILGILWRDYRDKHKQKE